MFLFFYSIDKVRGLCVERKISSLEMALMLRYFRTCTSIPFLKASYSIILFLKKIKMHMTI